MQMSIQGDHARAGFQKTLLLWTGWISFGSTGQAPGHHCTLSTQSLLAFYTRLHKRFKTAMLPNVTHCLQQTD
jgi:hypothetical protein